MCKQKLYRTDMSVDRAQAAYEGRTVRLDQYSGWTERSPELASRRSNSFPWWSLWLLWPLIVLMKSIGPGMLVGATALVDRGYLTIASPIAAIALMIIGLVFIIRN